MADYFAYREAVGITSQDMVLALRPHFPSVTKQIISIVNSPQLYGCCLIPEAEDRLVQAYGEGPGLSFPFRRLFRRLKGNQRPPENRKKNHRVTVWMPPDLYFRLLSLKTKEPYGTMTALVEAALTQFIQNEMAKRAEVIPVEES